MTNYNNFTPVCAAVQWITDRERKILRLWVGDHDEVHRFLTDHRDEAVRIYGWYYEDSPFDGNPWTAAQVQIERVAQQAVNAGWTVEAGDA
jgi:hypothetical protein